MGVRVAVRVGDRVGVVVTVCEGVQVGLPGAIGEGVCIRVSCSVAAGIPEGEAEQPARIMKKNSAVRKRWILINPQVLHLPNDLDGDCLAGLFT